MMKGSLSKSQRNKNLLTVLFAVIAILYVMPIVIVLINSFKSNSGINTQTFALPNAETFMGFDNYVKGVTFGNYNFWKCVEYSFTITILSTALIILCTSMAAWYISRVNSRFCRLVYYVCVFSMVVPFQMVMFTLAKTADTLKLNTPWTIPVIYLGFGAGLAVFMFVGFVKSMPDRDRGSRRNRRLRAAAHLLPRRVPDAEADHDLRRRAGDDVGLERLSAALSRARPHEVYDHPHPRAVSQGQLWYR